MRNLLVSLGMHLVVVLIRWKCMAKEPKNLCLIQMKQSVRLYLPWEILGWDLVIAGTALCMMWEAGHNIRVTLRRTEICGVWEIRDILWPATPDWLVGSSGNLGLQGLTGYPLFGPYHSFPSIQRPYQQGFLRSDTSFITGNNLVTTTKSSI